MNRVYIAYPVDESDHHHSKHAMYCRLTVYNQHTLSSVCRLAANTIRRLEHECYSVRLVLFNRFYFNNQQELVTAGGEQPKKNIIGKTNKELLALVLG